MNTPAFDHDPLETELCKLKPAAAPEDFVQRLIDARPPAREAVAPVPTRRSIDQWLAILFRWGAFAGAAALVAIAIKHFLPATSGPAPVKSRSPSLVADTIELNNYLVGTHDGEVLETPDGRVVRMTRFDWIDQVVLKDTAKGVVMERSSPRVQVVPVNLQTY